MDKQTDKQHPLLAIIFTGWLITMILMSINPELTGLTRNEFYALWLITSTIISLYGIFSNNLKGD